MNDQTRDIQDMSDQERKKIAESGPGGGNMLMDRQAFAQAYQVARLFSTSQLVPQHLQGKPHDCFIALHMADRLGEDPLMVMQNIVIIQGTAGWKAQWLIGRANRSGVFKGRIKFRTEGQGNDLKVTAYATMADTGEEVEAHADMKMAQGEGWTKNPKYQSMPQQMLSYRAASFLIRLYCPEATLGYQSAEEVEDMAVAGRMHDVTPGRHSPTSGGAEQALRNLPDGENGGRGPAEQLRERTRHSEDVTAREASGETTRWDKTDYFGTPWDGRIHAQTMTFTKDGAWRRKRGISEAHYQSIRSEIMASASTEPTETIESDDRAEAGEGTVSDESGPEEQTEAEQRGTSAEAPPGMDQETGEVPGPEPSADSNGSGNPDAELVRGIQRSVKRAEEQSDLDLLDDLEDEAREIANGGWREHCQNLIQGARRKVAAAAEQEGASE